MLYFTVSLVLYFRHILACSTLIQPYLFLLRYIKNPSILKNILLQKYTDIITLFRALTYLGTSYFWYIQLNNVRHIEVYLPTFEYVLVDSGIFRILAQLDKFMNIMAYSEPMAYLAIFRTVDIFNQFQTLLKSNSCIS